jgi:hypothetical protein
LSRSPVVENPIQIQVEIKMRTGPNQIALAVVCRQGKFVPQLAFASELSLTSLCRFLVGQLIRKKMFILYIIWYLIEKEFF